jgi:hypothetical protein
MLYRTYRTASMPSSHTPMPDWGCLISLSSLQGHHKSLSKHNRLFDKERMPSKFDMCAKGYNSPRERLRKGGPSADNYQKRVVHRLRAV